MRVRSSELRALMPRTPRCLLIVAATAAVLLGLAGCVFGDVVNKQLVGPYRLFAPDNEEELCVAYQNPGGGLTTRIENVVIDIGWDDRYVVATRRPEHDPGGRLSYYYLDIAKDTPVSSYDAVKGPLTEEEFEAAKGSLDLPEFTLHYPELR